jgi:hypothetical protein
MARRPEYLPHDEIVNELAESFRVSQRQILRQIQAAIRIGNLEFAAERRLQLAAVVAALDQLGAATEPATRRAVREAFEDGSERTAGAIGAQIGTRVIVPDAFTGVSVDAIRALQDSAIDRLRDARSTVGRRTEDLYAKAGRRAAVRALLGADGSPQQAARQLRRDLLRDPEVKKLFKDGVTGFVDRANKKWALDTYSEMVVRTTTRQAVVQGQVLRMASHGVNLCRVSMHASSCQICRPYEGRLISLDGSLTEWQGQTVGDSSVPLPPYHPNCRHTIEPVVIEIEELRQTMSAANA